MPAISAALIVRDEADRLGACLASLRPAVDEIVVVDTGSRDDTLAIAAAAGAVCGRFAWQDNFAAARNHAVSLASNDAILSFDADERIANPDADRELLRGFLETHGPHVAGTITLLSPMGPGPGARVAADELERVFDRRYYAFRGIVHEQLHPLAGEKSRARTGLRCTHEGYAQAPGAADHKGRRNLRLLRRALAEHPEDPYYWYQAGKAHFSLEEYGDAADAFLRAEGLLRFPASGARGRLPAMSSGEIAARPVVTGIVVTGIYALVNAGREAEALALASRHAEMGHAGVERADFHYAAGYLALIRGDLDAARAGFQHALALGPAAEDVLGAGGSGAHYHLGLTAEAAGAPREAFGHYLEALRQDPGYRPAIARSLEACAEYGLLLPAPLWEAAGAALWRGAALEAVQRSLSAGKRREAETLAAALEETAPALAAECVRVILDSAGE